MVPFFGQKRPRARLRPRASDITTMSTSASKCVGLIADCLSGIASAFVQQLSTASPNGHVVDVIRSEASTSAYASSMSDGSEDSLEEEEEEEEEEYLAFPEAVEDDCESSFMTADEQRVADEMLARAMQDEEEALADREMQNAQRAFAQLSHIARLAAERDAERMARMARRSKSVSTTFYSAAALQVWMKEDYAAAQWSAPRILSLNRTITRCLGSATCSCNDPPSPLVCGGIGHSKISTSLLIPTIFVNQLATAYVHLGYRRDSVVTVGLYQPRVKALRERGMIYLPEAQELLLVLQLLESRHGLGTMRFARLVLEQLFFVVPCPV